MTTLNPTSAATTPTSTGTTRAAASSTDKSFTSKVSLGNDINTFLKLLTSQLKNQDPLSPLDTNQFTSQLVQFSQVEQAINTNDKLTNPITLQSTNQLGGVLSMVGKTVKFADNQGSLVNGKAEFAYNLPANAANATLTISNAAGDIVARRPARSDEMTAG